jgi:hypothetical protein
MPDWQRRAKDLADDARKRRERVSPWALAGAGIAALIGFAAWVWVVF